MRPPGRLEDRSHDHQAGSRIRSGTCATLVPWGLTPRSPAGGLLFPDTFKDRLIQPLARPEIGLLEFLGRLFDVDESAFCGLLKNAERADHFQAAPRWLAYCRLGRR